MCQGPPTFIYFDLGNVLLLFDRQIACRQVGELVELPASRIDQLIYGSGQQARYEDGLMTSRQFHENFCASSGTRPDAEAFHLASSDMFRVNEPVIRLVHQLKRAGFRLGLLSNTCESHWRFLDRTRRYGIGELFEQTVLSFEVGASKPRSAIYDEAIRRAGCPATDLFFVDDREENVVAARQAGIDAEVFVDATRLDSDLRDRGVAMDAMRRNSCRRPGA
jgi:glucose-1-phosphatase